MSIWNKVLIGLLFTCSAMMFYFALQSLSSRTAYQKRIEKLENDIAKVEEDNHLLEFGIDAKTGKRPNARTLPKFEDGQFDIAEYEKFVQTGVYAVGTKESLIHLRNSVEILIKDRDSRSWFSCLPGRVFEQKTEVILTVQPEMNLPMIAPKTLVYLFDARPVTEGGSFLGAFYFEENAQNQVTLKNSYLMTPEEVDRLNQSKDSRASWTVYTKLPGDNSGYFAAAESATGENSEQLSRKMNPESQISTSAFEIMITERIKLQQHVDSLIIRLDQLKIAIQQAKEHNDYYEMVIARTQKELEESDREKGEVLALKNDLEISISDIKQKMSTLKAENRQIVAKMTKAQLQAVEKIHANNVASAAKTE